MKYVYIPIFDYGYAKDGQCALHYAALSSDDNMLRMLLNELHLDPDSRDNVSACQLGIMEMHTCAQTPLQTSTLFLTKMHIRTYTEEQCGTTCLLH